MVLEWRRLGRSSWRVIDVDGVAADEQGWL